MAKKHDHKEIEGKETVEVFQDLDKSALKTERWLERNAKTLSIIFGALVLGVIGWFAYQNFIVEPRNEEAAKTYLAALKNLQQGKEKEALGGTAANPGFLGTYEEYGNTKVGKLAAFSAASLKYKQGKYQDAYNLLDGFSSPNKIYMALKYGAMADCQSNLNKNDDAMSLLEKAITASDDPYTAYFFTRKAGMLALANNKKADAKKYFSSIEEKYTDYDNGMSDAFIEMVKYY